ncbi:30S ribosomal protein S15 [Polystyrenella longa]|uniref:Small ribosomal subunit protein uS15 n=1 Tax=Polystyrenella longa TaxID=2528007 RepID=A0A518CJU8_9PLAN|nr:30S ribosomal protein S15 [Polystyrenella longa]QDU79487.1 30S ribosomal protein S15 [Polystyrenella longa]
MSITQEEKQNKIAEFRTSDADCGSSEVQIALLTHRINTLTDHLKQNKKDHSSRRGLLAMVSRRRSLLDYLKKTNYETYLSMLERLSIRK